MRFGVGRYFVLAMMLASAPIGLAKANPLEAFPPFPPACAELAKLKNSSQLYGQLLMTGFIGSRPTTRSVRRLRRTIQKGHLGGVIFYARNIRNPRQLKRLTANLKPKDAPFIPFLALDEEGGRVERLITRKGFSWQTRPDRVARRGPEAARRTYARMAKEISHAGLNFNLAPVVDVNLNKSNPVIGRMGRSFSAKPHIVTFYARKFIEEHRRHGVLTSLKHFPGHGSSTRDTHKHLTDVTRQWKPVELLPYRALIETGLADGIMTAHVINKHGWSHSTKAVKSALPASLSGRALSVLREELEYDGIVLTDDLQMRGISKLFSLDKAIIKALQAGNDMVLIGNVLDYRNNLTNYALKAIERGVKRGSLDRSKLEKSFCRIMRAKSWLRRFEQMDQARLTTGDGKSKLNGVSRHD